MSYRLGLGLGPGFQAGRGGLSVGFVRPPTTGDKIVFWGDSTTELAAQMFDSLAQEVTIEGGEWAGATVVNRGYNGQTMAGAVDNMDDVIADAGTHYIICFGINDVRTGLTGGADTLAERITTAVNALRAALPAALIVLWTPNAMLTHDATGVYILPEAKSCEYSGYMKDAYKKLSGKFPDTLSVSKMVNMVPMCADTSRFLDSGDPLHPNAEGQHVFLGKLVDAMPETPEPIDLAASAAAWASNPTNPWTVYPRALDDERYVTLYRRLRMTTYVDLGDNMVAYIGPPFRERDINTMRPALASEFKIPGAFIWTPNGIHMVTQDEVNDCCIYGAQGTDSVQVSGMTPAAWGITGPVPVLVKLYHPVV